MPLGDAEIANGAFFKDFGSPVAFNGVTVLGNFDAPGKDAMFDRSNVLDVDYTVLIAGNAFSPMPTTGSRITVAGVRYEVREPTPVDDGALVELKLRKL